MLRGCSRSLATRPPYFGIRCRPIPFSRAGGCLRVDTLTRPCLRGDSGFQGLTKGCSCQPSNIDRGLIQMPAAHVSVLKSDKVSCCVADYDLEAGMTPR